MSGSDQTYCICRSKDDKRFMICCDNCNRWFHGDCVNVKAETAKKIEEFYCDKCRLEDGLEIVYKQKVGDFDMEPPKKRVKKECGNCIGCFRTEDCGRCDMCKENRSSGNKERRLTCRLRQCVNESPPNERVANKKKPQINSKSVSGAKLKNVSKKRPPPASGAPPMNAKVRLSGSSKVVDTKITFPAGTTRASAKAYKNFMKEAGLISDDEPEESRQCFGPGCVQPARPGSKYCSDESCGLKLAKARLLEILPGRINQWKGTPSIAEEFEKKRLEAIEQQMEAARQKLAFHVTEEEKLTNWLNESKQVKADSNRSDNDDDDVDLTISCVTCGCETSAKTALRHIVRCFNKYESQTSYGSAHRTFNNIYNIFCDTYNKTSHTYCKRLRVICPEHCKEPKIEDDDICGAPLNVDAPLDQFKEELACLAAKKTCLKHYKWDRVRRALIDLERLAQLLKLDELFDEQRALNAAIESRGGVLALLMHQTIKHSIQ